MVVVWKGVVVVVERDGGGGTGRALRDVASWWCRFTWRSCLDASWWRWKGVVVERDGGGGKGRARRGGVTWRRRGVVSRGGRVLTRRV